MSKQYLYPVYETNAWHSLEHRECKGIYTSKEEAIEAIVEHHEIPLEEFDGLTKIEQLEVCELIIREASNNGIEL